MELPNCQAQARFGLATGALARDNEPVGRTPTPDDIHKLGTRPPAFVLAYVRAGDGCPLKDVRHETRTTTVPHC